MTFLISMVPVAELRLGIPYGVVRGLAPLLSMLVCVVGSCLPVLVLIPFTRRVFAFLHTWDRTSRLVTKLEARAHLKGNMARKYGKIGLMVLVAIPLPGTGAWTGALVAALMDMRLKAALPAIGLGNFIAGIIVTSITYGVGALI